MSETDQNTNDTPPRLAPLPDYQCYDCVGCGDCCKGLFIINLTPEDYTRLQGQGWEREPDLQGKRLVEIHGKRIFLTHREDGACIFLDERGLCRIHAKFGLLEKPTACRLYPFKVLWVDQEVRSDLRYGCPAVAGSRGRPLSAYQAEVESWLPNLHPLGVRGAPPAPLHDASRPGWPALLRITQSFVYLLGLPELDFTERIVAALDLAGELRALHLEALDDSSLEVLLQAFVSRVTSAIAANPLERRQPPALVRLSFRQLLSIYGREDRFNERKMILRDLRRYLRMLGGQRLTPTLRKGFPEVPFAVLEEALGIPPDDIMAPLMRYFRLRLESMGFFGPGFYGYNYLDGLAALLLNYPLICWFARADAAGRGLFSPDRASFEEGLRIIGHCHGILPILNSAPERAHLRFLSKPSVLRELICWYGR